MKKTLLSLGLAALSFGTFAQLNEAGDKFTLNNLDEASNCYASEANLPNNGGVMADDAGTFDPTGLYMTTEGLVLESLSDATGESAIWFALPAITGEGEAAQCKGLYNVDREAGLNMTTNTKVAITVSSDTEGAELEFYLGGLGQWSPATSTYNLGEPSFGTIEAVATITEADVSQTIILDFDAEKLGGDAWTDWVAKATIQSYGFRSKTEDAVFAITKIEFGYTVLNGLEANAIAAGFEVYPNPAQDVVNFNYTINGNASVELSNALGSVVSLTEGTAMNVAELPSGVYFATLKVNGVATAVQRVQIQ